MRIAPVIFVAFVAACGGGGSGTSGGGGGGGSSTQSAAQESVSQTLSDLRAGGQLPSLDHSQNLAGTDSNTNGVRDDVDTWIDALGASQSQTRAATQLAAALQSSLSVNPGDQSAVSNAASSLARSVNCLSVRFDPATSTRVIDDIEKITMDTRERTLAYLAFANALNGSTVQLPDGNTCD